MKTPAKSILFALFMVPISGSIHQGLVAQEIAGTWEGTLHDSDGDMRTVLKITKNDGALKGVLYSIDQGGDPMAFSSVSLKGSSLSFAISSINGSFTGKVSADDRTIEGAWTQDGKPLPLTLVRADKETAWEIPKPTDKMAPNADPSFEVATIKPTKLPANVEEEGKSFDQEGRTFSTQDTSLDDLIEYAYDVHSKQILGAPEWATSAKFDISGVADKPGEPSDEQTKSMMQKLLADRFQLKFHREKKEMPVYVLSVGKNGPKNLTKSASPVEGFSIPIGGARGGLKMSVINGTMTNFAIFGLQGAVLDRPVLDQTGLPDRYDFTLTWLPDDSQFGGHLQMHPGNNPQPNLFTAVQEQLGLKLEPTKARADVMIIDHVDRPSAN